ncbi:MAG: hypothetical protein WD872_16685 [Pirellulaceae bacterium]
MSLTQQLREQIDACRPGGEDLHLPELAELAQAVEQDRAVAAALDRARHFDLALANALHDQPVPSDLLERLLAQTRNAEAPAADVPTVELPPPAASSFRKTSGNTSRRRMLVLSSAAAVAAALAGLGLFLPRAARDVPRDELVAAVQEWMNEVPAVEGWQALPAQAAPAGYPRPSSAILRAVPHRWRYHETPYGQAVVFDYTPSGRQRVLLFVVRSPDRFLGIPPVNHWSKTLSGNRALGAWQKGRLLYVLTVVEDNQRLDDYLLDVPVT